MDSEKDELIDHLQKTVAYLLKQYKLLQEENEQLKEKIRSFYG
jgi:hypothetical protein